MPKRERNSEVPLTICAIHTGFALVEPLKPLFRELLPGARITTLVDDSILADVRAAGRLTAAVTQRICAYGMLAESAGADAILNCCSSVGEAADVLSSLVEIPVVKIDNRMAEEAARLGSRIAVIGTVATTLDPTSRLIARKAEAAGKQAQIRRYVAEGAFDALMSGRTAEHDRMVLETVNRAGEENDVVVLAQGSMARLAATLQGPMAGRVLTSPRLGLEELRERCGAARGGAAA